MKWKFYNNDGVILFGRNWPEVPQIQASIYQDEMLLQKFKRELKECLKYPVSVLNPEVLPHIPERHFLDAEGYTWEIREATVLIKSCPDKNVKEQAIELVRKLLPLMYCYSGSGMLANWYEHTTALTNAVHSCRIIGTSLLPEVEKLTVNDFWTEEELKAISHEKERKYPCICGRQYCTLSLADLLKDIPAIVGYWQQRCKLAEKYLAAVPIDQSQWSSTSAEHHKQMYHEFIRDNQKPE